MADTQELIEELQNREREKYKVEAMTFQRIFTMLALLKADLSFVLTSRPRILKNIETSFGKKSNEYVRAKEYFDAHSFGFDAIVNTTRRLDATVKDRNRLMIVKDEMTSERIADLHAFLDQILEVKNINILTDILKIGLERFYSEVTEQETISETLQN